jgi:AraC-like DNA-binding protein
VRRTGHRAEFGTTDRERAETHLAAAYGVNLKIRDHHGAYRFRHVRAGPGPFYLDTVDHTATTEYLCSPFAGLTAVRIHRGVRTDVGLDERIGPGDLSVNTHTEEPFRVRQEALLASFTTISPGFAAAVAANRPDDELPPLRFTSMRPVDPAAVRRWVQTVTYVTDSLQTVSEFITQPLLAGSLARLLAATMLSTFPNTWISEPDPHDRTDATPTAVSRAIAFIETNADLDISVADIARAARVTVRALRLAFRRHLNTTPTAYLRRVRLEHAHEQLMAAHPSDDTTTAQVAARWGYADPRRFATAYHEIYGQPPDRILRD